MSAIKFGECLSKFMIPIALLEKVAMELLGDKGMTLWNHWRDQDVPYEHEERTLDTLMA